MMEEVNGKPGSLCGQKRVVSTTVSPSLTGCSISQDGQRPCASHFCVVQSQIALSLYGFYLLI